MQFKNDSLVPEGIIFSDLGSVCEPITNITSKRLIDKWESVPYETAAVSGTMLSAFQTASPEPVFLRPNLTGWYKIYVSLLDSSHDNRVFLRLTDDEAQSSIRPSGESANLTWWSWERFQECFWKCADMSGQSVEISRRVGPSTVGCHVAWFRFVPMSQAEIEEWKMDEERLDTKRLFASHDMFSAVATEAPNSLEDWRLTIENLKHSDVEVLSLGESMVPETYIDTKHGSDYSFYSNVRRDLYFNLLKKNQALYEDLINTGHKNGIKMYLAKRMGAKLGAAFPFDGEDYGTEFAVENFALRCQNRDGEWVDSLSFGYLEVQDYVISSLIRLAKLSCDGISLIYTRGIPFVLFEKPFTEKFVKRYPGINPCELPLSDERVHGLHCEMMTEFMRRLRHAVDDECRHLGRNRMAINVHVGSSLYDNRLFGLDVEAWAKEKLIDSFSAYPLRITERLENVMQEENPKLIDLEKYKKVTKEAFHKTIHRDVEYANNIELNFVKEYVDMAKKYGVKAYFDILPRLKSPEDYVEDALKLMENGAENFSLWDCDGRAEVKAEWVAASRLGHLEELKQGKIIQNPATLYRILSINGKNIGLYNPTWFG